MSSNTIREKKCNKQFHHSRSKTYHHLRAKIHTNFNSIRKDTQDMILINCDRFHTLSKFLINFNSRMLRGKDHLSKQIVWQSNLVRIHWYMKMASHFMSNENWVDTFVEIMSALTWFLHLSLPLLNIDLFQRNFLFVARCWQSWSCPALSVLSDDDKHQIICDLILRKILKYYFNYDFK